MRMLLWLSISAFVCWTAPGAWQNGAAFRPAPLSVPRPNKTGFTLLSERTTGIRFTNHLADQSVAENQIRLIGSGVALGDVDGDGLCDIYLCRLEGPNALYRNLGNWKFEDITAAAGVACDGQYSTGCTLADVDGDGDLDLLVNSIGGGTRCFFNDGKGRFRESNSGLTRKFCATSMALADIDGNGTLDLYVANYRTTTIRSTGLQVLNVNGRRVLRPQDRESYEITPEGLIIEHAEEDVVYLNDGHGGFSPLSWRTGRFIDADGKPLTRGDKDWGLSVMFRDMNGDGAPDIYVCNDFWSADAIWINDGQGSFRALPKLAMRNSSTFSMGVDFADINRDGFDDFIVLDMRSREHARRMVQRSMLGNRPVLTHLDERPQTERNTLFLNRGDGTFAEIAQLAGLDSSEWSWCPVFLDVDLDGYEDLLVTTGHGFDSQDADVEEQRDQPQSALERLLRYPRLDVPNQAFRNRGDLTFTSAGDAWGFNAVGVSHGMALGDLDGDGDLDLVVNNLNGAAGIYRNETSAPRLAVRLKGKAPNTQGIGAKIKITGGPVAQSQEMISGGRYLSSDDSERVFAAWSRTNRFTITVEWRNRTMSVVSNAEPNFVYEIDEADAVARNAPKVAAAATAPLFKDVSASLAHVHRDPPFDEFARQPLLSRRLGHSGPGIAWADLDGDGRDDLVIGSGRGGDLAVFRNGGNGTFESLPVPSSARAAPDDQMAVIAGRDAAGAMQLFVSQANYETLSTNLAAALRLTLRDGVLEPKPSLPPQWSSAGAMALGDIDGDGDLDLFVAGQMNPGHYPEPATSRLFRNDKGTFVLVQELKDAGLVNGAVFSDLNGDGRPELVLACEWGPLKVFRISNGVLTEMDSGLGKYRGWWQGVTAGDFDGDGLMDLAASNWGRNTPYQASIRDEIRIFFGDFSGSGWSDGVEAYVEGGRVVPRSDLDTLARALPWLRQRFPTHHDFARASIADVLGPRISQAKELRVNWPESTVFLNRGDHFEAHILPLEAQFAPSFGVSAADFDGDGREDLILAQNFFAVEPHVSRFDAGRGLWLRGNGDGTFQTVSSQESGIAVYGEGRAVAACDYDGDGRIDVCLGQNGEQTKLYHNECGRAGLRVRLHAGPENPNAIGATLRPVLASNQFGPAREIHAGTGWLSQDSAVQVLSRANEIKALWVRWPGGRITRTEVPPNAHEVFLNTAGKLVVNK